MQQAMPPLTTAVANPVPVTAANPLEKAAQEEAAPAAGEAQPPMKPDTTKTEEEGAKEDKKEEKKEPEAKKEEAVKKEEKTEAPAASESTSDKAAPANGIENSNAGEPAKSEPKEEEANKVEVKKEETAPPAPIAPKPAATQTQVQMTAKTAAPKGWESEMAGNVTGTAFVPAPMPKLVGTVASAAPTAVVPKKQGGWESELAGTAAGGATPAPPVKEKGGWESELAGKPKEGASSPPVKKRKVEIAPKDAAAGEAKTEDSKEDTKSEGSGEEKSGGLDLLASLAIPLNKQQAVPYATPNARAGMVIGGIDISTTSKRPKKRSSEADELASKEKIYVDAVRDCDVLCGRGGKSMDRVLFCD